MSASVPSPLGPLQAAMTMEAGIDVSQDLISIRFQDVLSRRLRLDLSLNNWGPTGNNDDIGYKYVGVSDGSAILKLGATTRLSIGSSLVASGKIIRLAPAFPDGTNPVLILTARGHHRKTVTPSSVLDGTDAVTESTHSLDALGYRTSFLCEKPMR